MGEKETTLKEVGEMLAYVVEHMATKEELLEVKSVLRGIVVLRPSREVHQRRGVHRRGNYRYVRATLKCCETAHKWGEAMSIANRRGA